MLVAEMNEVSFTLWFAALVATDFHSCMHGGERNKRTRLLASAGLYDELAADCDNSHPHKLWFVVRRGSGLEFATAFEAEYPRVLATRVAAYLRRQAEAEHLQLGPNLSPAKSSTCLGSADGKAKPLIPEFKAFHHADVEESKPGYRLLATPSQGARHTELPSEDQGQHETEQKRLRKTFKYGIQ